ncbi:MAG TPA: radical SAM protein, partial [Planctomycetota bacterium]|nr:radical SAM protein [Planctomycetota bacterium]
MSGLYDRTRALLRASLRDSPGLRRALVEAETLSELARHSLAGKLPQLIRPRTRKLTVAITAYCNLRCIGCRYGRDFMPGRQLSLEMVRDLLDDGRAGGAEVVRLYGGEPLLHPDLPAMVRHATELGLTTYVTTNGVLLEERLDELVDAGLRDLTFGFYGTGAEYDEYVQRTGRFERVERGLAAARERYGDMLSLQLNFLIMRPSCNPESLAAAWDFACRYDMSFHTDLVHYSLPYFAPGLDGELQFRAED